MQTQNQCNAFTSLTPTPSSNRCPPSSKKRYWPAGKHIVAHGADGQLLTTDAYLKHLEVDAHLLAKDIKSHLGSHLQYICLQSVKPNLAFVFHGDATSLGVTPK